MMAGFDLHSVCACCGDKKKGQDPCVEKPGSDCHQCSALTPEQLSQLSMPTYNMKEKRELKYSTPAKNPPPSGTTQSHPCGPGTCVGSGGCGWPEHLRVAWFE